MTHPLQPLNHTPRTAIFRKERRLAGPPRYWPVNEAAENICKLAGLMAITQDKLRFVRALGFAVEEDGCQALPHPGSARVEHADEGMS